MIGKKKKQIEELATMLEKQTKQAQRQLLPMEEYERAKWGTPKSSTNIYEPKTYLTNWQKQLLEDSQKEEFDKNLGKLSKIIEAKKHDEEKDLSMARQFESFRRAGLL